MECTNCTTAVPDPLKIPAVVYLASMIYHALVTATNGKLPSSNDIICCAVPASFDHDTVELYHTAWRLLGLPGTFTTAVEPLCALLSLLYKRGLCQEDVARMEEQGDGIVVISDNGGGSCGSYALHLVRDDQDAWTVTCAKESFSNGWVGICQELGGIGRRGPKLTLLRVFAGSWLARQSPNASCSWATARSPQPARTSQVRHAVVAKQTGAPILRIVAAALAPPHPMPLIPCPSSHAPPLPR
jgi:hypothetical protein